MSVDDKLPLDVQSYRKMIQPKVENFSSLSANFGPLVIEQVKIFCDALFEVTPRYLTLAHAFSMPSQTESLVVYKVLSEKIQSVVSMADANKGDDQFNKLMSLKAASEALSWVLIAPKPAVHIKEASDQSLFYANRVRKDGGDVDKDWVKALLQLMTELQNYVQDFHPSGLLWKGSTKCPANLRDVDLASLVEQLDISAGAGGSAAQSNGASQAAAGGSTSEFAGYYGNEVGPKIDEFLAKSKAIGDLVATQAEVFSKCAKVTIPEFFNLAEAHSAPTQAEAQSVYKPVVDCLGEINSLADSNPRHAQFNMLASVKAASEAFTWISVTGRPHDFVKECSDQSLFYANRVRKDGGDAEKEWVKSLMQVMTGMQAFTKEYYPSGLVWKGKTKVNSSGAPPPPPPAAPGMPPPPPPPAAVPLADPAPEGSGGDGRAALFAQLNAGSDVTKGLKKVTKDMQTHKNPALRGGAVVTEVGAKKAEAKPAATAPAKAAKPPKMELEQGKKWIVENYKGETLTIEVSSIKQTVYIYNCTNTTIVVKNKANSISVDGCSKCGIVFDDLLSSLDIVNSKSIQCQAMGKMPLLNIDKTDGAQVYLSPECLTCEIVTAKSSEMNVLIPQDDGDFGEYPIPEQFKTTFDPAKKKLNTTCSESLG